MSLDVIIVCMHNLMKLFIKIVLCFFTLLYNNIV